MPCQNRVFLKTDILWDIVHGRIIEMCKLKDTREMTLEVIPPHANHEVLNS